LLKLPRFVGTVSERRKKNYIKFISAVAGKDSLKLLFV